ncbi:hypothetical protein D3C81_2168880 [compost metagenome]
MADASSSAAMPTRTIVWRPKREMKAGARKKAAMLIAALPPNHAENPSSEYPSCCTSTTGAADTNTRIMAMPAMPNIAK